MTKEHSQAKSSDTLVNGAVGFAVAFFLMVGRWTFGRISEGTENLALLEPRSWVAFGLLGLVLIDLRTSTYRARWMILLRHLVFLGYFLLSMMWAPGHASTEDKAYELCLVALVLFALHRVIQKSGASVVSATVVQALFWLALALAVVSVLGGVTDTATARDRASVLGGGPNVFGRNMALLFVIALAAVFKRKGFKHFVAYNAVALGALMLAVLSGSRGAIVAATAGLLTLLWVGRVRLHKWAIAGLCAALGGAFFLTYTKVGKNAEAIFQERVVRLSFEERYLSGRAKHYDDAIDLGTRNPTLGIGVGGYAEYALDRYPHNIALEAFAEGGGVGVILLLVMLLPTLHVVLRRRDPLEPLMAACFMTFFMSAQFSGDFFDSRGVFVFSLLVVYQAATRTASKGRKTEGVQAAQKSMATKPPVFA